MIGQAFSTVLVVVFAVLFFGALWGVVCFDAGIRRERRRRARGRRGYIHGSPTGKETP